MPTTPGTPPRPERPTLGRVLLTIFLGGPCAVCFLILCYYLLMSVLYGPRLPLQEVGVGLIGLLLSGAGMLLATGHLRHWLYVLPFILYVGTVAGLEWLFPTGDGMLNPFALLLGAIPALGAAEGIRRYYASKDRRGDSR